MEGGRKGERGKRRIYTPLNKKRGSLKGGREGGREEEGKGYVGILLYRSPYL